MIIYQVHIIPKWIINDLYIIDSENKVRNIRTGKALQMQLKGYTRGYYLNGKFMSLKQIRARLRKCEEQVTPF